MLTVSDSRGPILVLFARRPRPGAVKTRLAAEIGDAGALAIHTACVRDSIGILRRTSPFGIRPAIAWLDEAVADTPAGDPAVRATDPSSGSPVDPPPGPASRTGADQGSGAATAPAVAPALFTEDLAGFEKLKQHGEDLGQRMLDCMASLLARGHDRVAILGSDTPSLPVEILKRAFEQLRGHDVVLGPCTDGGYYLIGARCVVPEIFRDIPWGTDRVLADTLTLLKILGIGKALLPPWSDVDTAADLRELRAALAALAPGDPTARHTRAALEQVLPPA